MRLVFATGGHSQCVVECLLGYQSGLPRKATRINVVAACREAMSFRAYGEDSKAAEGILMNTQYNAVLGRIKHTVS